MIYEYIQSLSSGLSTVPTMEEQTDSSEWNKIQPNSF